MKKQLLFICFLFIQLFGYSLILDDKNKFSKAAKEQNELLDYSDEAHNKKMLKKKPKTKQDSKQIPLNLKDSKSKNNIFMYLLSSALFIIFIIFIYFIIKQKKEIKSLYSSDKESDDFAKLNLNDTLKDYLFNEDYRLACRILYLQLLQDLVKLNLIFWRNEKTNWDYYHEAQATKKINQDNLNKITLRYDVLWYGEKVPSLIAFNEFKNLISNYKN